MRKFLLLVLATSFLIITKAQNVQRCGSNEIIKQQMAIDPVYAKKVNELLKNRGNYSPSNQKGKPENPGKPSAPSSITIPVAVHVLYYYVDQNISDAQVQSQIDVLNEDYTASNSDYNNYDAGYRSVKGDLDIKFCLVQVIHKQTQHKSFGFNDNMKYSKKGGSDAVDPMHVLNIWVCDIGDKLLGFAYYPGISPEKFGVVCHTKGFGRGAGYNLFANYDLGRTTTHEVGHCLGLAHIWGDAKCGDDFVDDTPLHNDPNFGCPGEGHSSTCTGTPLEMWMNYMDYTYDKCMYFFSDGQAERALSFIDSDPQLNSIVNSVCGTTLSTNSSITSASNKNLGSSKTILSNDLVVYPTITSGILNLSIGKVNDEKMEINVYNQTGSLVIRKQITGKTVDQIDVSNLINGVYFIEVSQALTRQTRKFVVQH